MSSITLARQLFCSRRTSISTETELINCKYGAFGLNTNGELNEYAWCQCLTLSDSAASHQSSNEFTSQTRCLRYMYMYRRNPIDTKMTKVRPNTDNIDARTFWCVINLSIPLTNARRIYQSFSVAIGAFILTHSFGVTQKKYRRRPKIITLFFIEMCRFVCSVGWADRT